MTITPTEPISSLQAYEAPGGVDLVPNPLAAARQSLREQAQMMADAKALADAMCASDLVPTVYRGKPGNGAAAILYGTEIGLNAIQSLQQIFIIHGKPGIEARVMVALVRNHGHKVQVVEEEDDRVVVRGLRKGDTADEAYYSEWTIERARTAGYAPDENGKGGNQKYNTNRREMLKAKAFADVCRTIAPDVLLGIAYTVDELRDDPVHVDVQRTDTAPARDWRTQFGLQVQPAREIGGGTSKATSATETALSAAKSPAKRASKSAMDDLAITPPQVRAIERILTGDPAKGGKGYELPDDWSAILAWMVTEQVIDAPDGRRIESLSGLTTGEGGAVIGALNDPNRTIPSAGQVDTDEATQVEDGADQ